MSDTNASPPSPLQALSGRTLLAVAVLFMAGLGGALFLAIGQAQRMPTDLKAPNVTVLRMDCGEDAGPLGTQMPGQPEDTADLEKHYVRQHWSQGSGLVVEVWQFLRPEQVLTALSMNTQGSVVTLQPSWSPSSSLTVCYAKTGVVLRMPDMPDRSYEIRIAPPTVQVSAVQTCSLPR